MGKTMVTMIKILNINQAIIRGLVTKSGKVFLHYIENITGKSLLHMFGRNAEIRLTEAQKDSEALNGTTILLHDMPSTKDAFPNWRERCA